jgi:transposase-like protein
MVDPYLPPSAPIDSTSPAAAGTVRCPKCGSTASTKVNYTFWGGALGPRLFHVVRCDGCRTQYNGQTGAALTRVIILYQVVVFAIAGAVLGAYLALR